MRYGRFHQTRIFLIDEMDSSETIGCQCIIITDVNITTPYALVSNF